MSYILQYHAGVPVGSNTPTEMSYEDWSMLTDGQKAVSGDVLVKDVPSDLVFVEPSILEGLVEKLKYTPSYVGMITENNLDTLEKMQEVFGSNTTWELFGVGRTTVGVGDGTREYGEEFGEDTHTLTLDEMPSHAHNVTIANDMNYPVVAGSRSSYAISGASVWTDASVKYGGDFWVMANSNGGNLAHNNVQKSKGVYRWIRTA